MELRIIILTVLILNLKEVNCQINFQDQASARGAGASCGIIDYGGGISFFDYNNDGMDDITIATEDAQNLIILKNISEGFFIPETNLVPINTFQQRHPAWVDYDNDGDFDLYVTSDTGGNRLYENNGGNLTDVTVESGLPMPNILTFGASWGDYNNDGFLDVFLSNRDVNFQIPNYLFKNNGDGTFSNVSEIAGIGTESHLSFCSAFFDYNNDGWQDIYVANDKTQTQNLLYRNNGNGTFTEVGESSYTNISIDAMSTTIGDYNNDGWFDIYVTNGLDGNVLFKNNGDGTFTDMATISGTTFNSAAWGSVFLDAENDGDLDLYVSAESDGTVSGLLSSAFYENQTNNTFSLLNNGSFNNDNAQSYANAIGDIDNDGYPEIIVNNSNNDDLFLWKNQTTQNNNWLKVKLEGTTSNRQGIGSTIEISVNGHKQYRYTLCGEGYLGQNSGTEFFGIGSDTVIDYVKVTWLSGIEDILYNVSVNQTLNIVEGSNLSINNYENDGISIYPNPTDNYLNVKTNEIGDFSFRIFDLSGRLIKTGKINKNRKIDIGDISSGHYFIKLQNQINYNVLSFLKN
ncbi:FG-GAP-like repeat-containing protein [Winogradskyella aquimaris]|uniref:FG-GAP-like repeat-containing protein n=1 Tax=Winogradskyella aquimaris TaxID=864074 RepID=A0ABU5ESJ3_9FLAO|nr:FG-GAP-like repeat-containing protein [Winogradskyella aquimaris]MDY2587657.1 FG-GAP-like repeat-containing protein [Winogradskyella aquimaris]